MMEKIIVVAPTTAVPMRTGFAVALNVLPAPSFCSRRYLAVGKSGENPYCFLTSSCTPGICSITESSKTDCALSVTGPYESTAMVTGPIPRNPNATRPNAKTGDACISVSKLGLMAYAIPISEAMTRPSQYALKFPATSPARMLSEAPPSFEEDTISLTCADSVDVKIFTSSGMIAPARVPQVITDDNFHQSVPSPRFGMSRYETA